MAFLPGNTASPSTATDGIVGKGQLGNNETISATRVLTNADRRIQVLTPSGAIRIVQLPTTAIVAGEAWAITCAASSGFGLTVQSSNGTTIVTLNPGEAMTYSANIATPVAATDWSFSGVAVTATLAQTLLNKVVSSTAAITGALTLPSGTVANRSALATVGMIRHNTDANEFEGFSNGTWASVGGGLNEQPVKNYLKTFSNASVAPGTVSNLASTTANLVSLTAFYTGTAANASAVTSPANTELRGSTNYLTAALTSNPTGTSFVQFPAFALEGADLGKPVMLNFDILGVTADGNWDVVVVRYNSSGVHQSIISVAGNASAATPASAKLPTGTSRFSGFWVPDSITPSDLYAVRPRSLAGSVAVRFDTLFSGPQVLMQTGALTDPIITTGITVSGFGATPTVASVYSRIGQNAHIRTVVKVTAASGYGNHVFTLPAELTPDFTKIPGQEGGFGTTNAWVGEASIVNTSTGTLWKGRVLLNTSRQMTPYGPNGQGDWNGTVPVALSTNMSITLDVIIPIVGWSSNVTAGDRSVSEYASNSGVGGVAANTIYTTGSVQGALGSQFVSVNSVTSGGNTKYRLDWATAIQATDTFIIQTTQDFGVTFQNEGGSISYIGRGRQGASEYGMWTEPINASQNYIVFGNQGRMISNAGYAGSGAAWSDIAGSAQYLFRVLKVSGGAVVGFPIGSPNITGRTDGIAQPAGIVGEVINGTNLSPALGSSGVVVNHYSIALTAGNWRIEGTTGFNIGTTAVVGSDNYIVVSVSSTSASEQNPLGITSLAPVGSGGGRQTGTSRCISISASATWFLTARHGITTAGNASVDSGTGFFRAVRIS